MKKDFIDTNEFTKQELLDIIDHKDGDRMKQYLKKIRDHVRRDIEKLKN